jgi:hypothetical protein
VWQIKEVIRQGVEVPEGQNDLRRMQLRELAQLNGTLREHDAARCANCTATDHKTWLVSTLTHCWILSFLYFTLFKEEYPFFDTINVD